MFLVDLFQVPGCVWMMKVLLTCRTRDGMMVSQIITATKIALQAVLQAGTMGIVEQHAS